LKNAFPGSFVISAMSEQAIDAAQGPADPELKQRLDQSEAVIAGVVSSISPFSPQRPGSEHDPGWQQATIEVESVEKGKATTKTIPVLFANSPDIAWSRSPKLKKGDRGIWLLQNRDPFGRAVPGLAVVNPADKQPIQELAKIRMLLQNPAER
jgi:hypothetical protein